MHQVFKWFEVLSIASVVVQIISIQIVFSDMINNLESMNEKGTHLSQITDIEIRQIALFCDASDSGYGGHFTLCSKDEQQELEWYGFWNEWESIQSSTWRSWKR